MNVFRKYLPQLSQVCDDNGGVLATTRKTIGAVVRNSADSVDQHLANGVESFVEYMYKHPGFSAVLSPSSVIRRIAYRQTENTINTVVMEQVVTAVQEYEANQ